MNRQEIKELERLLGRATKTIFETIIIRRCMHCDNLVETATDNPISLTDSQKEYIKSHYEAKAFCQTTCRECYFSSGALQ